MLVRKGEKRDSRYCILNKRYSKSNIYGNVTG
uniref:Uncharacterized protein n=1 Tax=Lepeophtheirus salmonis TaxID=72036 RepID=A0A0K2UJS8_LEPSM